MKVCCDILCPFETLSSSHSLFSPTLLHWHPPESSHPSSARVHLCTVQSLRRCLHLLTLAQLESPPVHAIFSRHRRCRRGQIHPPRMLVYLGHSANVEKSTSVGAIFRTTGNDCTLHLRSPWDNREHRRLPQKRMPSSVPGFEVLACKLQGYWKNSSCLLALFPKGRLPLVGLILFTPSTHSLAPPTDERC